MSTFRVLPSFTPFGIKRTREENQERAYIAASRRSDRGLEARIESARRASEIHKRRTGRFLRVTEQAVLNEEIYEEEADDVPVPYYQAIAHLQTTSTAFDPNVAEYLANYGVIGPVPGTAVSDGYSQPQQPTSLYPTQPVQPCEQGFLSEPMLLSHIPSHGYQQKPYQAHSQQIYQPDLHTCALWNTSLRELQHSPSPQIANVASKDEYYEISLPIQRNAPTAQHMPASP